MLPRMLPILVPSLLGSLALAQTNSSSVDLSWHAPSNASVSDLGCALNDTACDRGANGVYDFVFNSSFPARAGVPYGTYDWCDMPHVRASEYRPLRSNTTAGLKLRYVELIHRHHKRTPYAANSFPVETQYWNCSDARLQYYGTPTGDVYNASAPMPAAAYWSVFTSAVNPFRAQGFPGNCEFPQITGEGLVDSWQHGKDLYGVYHDMLHLIPDNALEASTRGYNGSYTKESPVTFRVSNNVITSQVAGMVINGMFGTTANTPLLIEAPAIDSLEPTYSCPAASALYASYGVGSNVAGSPWAAHLNGSAALTSALDSISGVSASQSDWHVSWDHYFDNLSARLCHQKPLPCNSTTNACVSAQQAAEVFRLGEWEYSYIYRAGGAPSLQASAGSYGVWIAELAQHLRDVRGGTSGETVYRHNVAHDGSVSRLLSVLQIDKMVWPGMGSEVVFELYSAEGKDAEQWFVRILWNGQTLHSSSPTLGVAEMVPLETLLAYFDGLVGRNASMVPGLCSS